MKTCKKIQDLIPLYIDNELNHKQLKQVEKHLEDCKDCQVVHLEMQNIIEALGRQDFSVDRNYSQNLTSNVYKKVEAREQRQWGFKLATAITVGILVIVSIYSDLGHVFNSSSKTAQIDIEQKDFETYLSLLDNGDSYDLLESVSYLQDNEIDLDISEIAYSFLADQEPESYEDIVALSSSLSEDEYSLLVKK